VKNVWRSGGQEVSRELPPHKEILLFWIVAEHQDETNVHDASVQQDNNNTFRISEAEVFFKSSLKERHHGHMTSRLHH